MIKNFINLFNRNERIKKKAISSEEGVADILDIIRKGSDRFRAKDTQKEEKCYGFDYFITDSNWFFYDKKILGFFIENQIIYPGVIHRTSNFADPDEKTVLHYELGETIYKFERNHALYNIFKEIANELDAKTAWEQNYIPKLESLEVSIKEIEKKVGRLKSSLTQNNEKIISTEIIMKDSNQKDYFAKILSELKEIGNSLSKEIKQAQIEKNILKKDKERLVRTC